MLHKLKYSWTGGWFFPNGTALPEGGIGNTNPSPISQMWLDQRIRLQRGPSSTNISTIPSGIYQCDIAISDSEMETFYVGIYLSEGRLLNAHFVVLLYGRPSICTLYH